MGRAEFCEAAVAEDHLPSVKRCCSQRYDSLLAAVGLLEQHHRCATLAPRVASDATHEDVGEDAGQKEAPQASFPQILLNKQKRSRDEQSHEVCANLAAPETRPSNPRDVLPKAQPHCCSVGSIHNNSSSCCPSNCSETISSSTCSWNTGLTSTCISDSCFRSSCSSTNCTGSKGLATRYCDSQDLSNVCFSSPRGASSPDSGAEYGSEYSTSDSIEHQCTYAHTSRHNFHNSSSSSSRAEAHKCSGSSCDSSLPEDRRTHSIASGQNEQLLSQHKNCSPDHGSNKTRLLGKSIACTSGRCREERQLCYDNVENISSNRIGQPVISPDSDSQSTKDKASSLQQQAKFINNMLASEWTPQSWRRLVSENIQDIHSHAAASLQTRESGGAVHRSAVIFAERFPVAQNPFAAVPAAAMSSVTQQLKQLPPLVSPGEIDELLLLMRRVFEGQMLLLVGGDCAERFADCCEAILVRKLQVLLHMALVLSSVSPAATTAGRDTGGEGTITGAAVGTTTATLRAVASKFVAKTDEHRAPASAAAPAKKASCSEAAACGARVVAPWAAAAQGRKADDDADTSRAAVQQSKDSEAKIEGTQPNGVSPATDSATESFPTRKTCGVVIVGRFAGQYGKPRPCDFDTGTLFHVGKPDGDCVISRVYVDPSHIVVRTASHEEVDGRTVLTYRGDAVHGFDPADRVSLKMVVKKLLDELQ